MLEIPHLFQNKQTFQNAFIKCYQSDQESIKSQIRLTSFMFNFILEGSKQLTYWDESSKLNAPSFVLLRPSHCLMTEKLSRRQSYQSLLCFFSPALITQILAKYHFTATRPAVQQQFLVFQSDPYIQHFIQSILFLTKSPQIKEEQLIALKIEELILYLVQTHGIELLNFFFSSHQLEAEINFEQTIQQHIETKLTIEELAFLCQMSSSTFKRKFKQKYHSSPAKWFQQKRLEKAKNLLVNHAKTPSEIYMEVGFENFSSFSQAFKKEFGQSPKQYQKTSL